MFLQNTLTRNKQIKQIKKQIKTELKLILETKPNIQPFSDNCFVLKVIYMLWNHDISL